MNNIIQSDLYRIRKGIAMRNTLLGLLVIIIIAGGFLALMSSGVFQNIIENEINHATLSEGVRVGLEGEIADMNEVMDALPHNAADFTGMMISQNILALLALIIVVAVMGADFGAGAFRNTLSYETDRKKVYLGKLVVNLILLLALMAANVLFSGIVGSVFFGFDGFSGEFLVSLLTALVLQIPVYMALLSFAQCVLAFTKKSGATIAAYLIVVTFSSSIIQFIAMLLPTMRWILRLDFISAVKLVTQYQTAPAADIIAPLILSFCVLAGTTALGMSHYLKADMH